MPITDAQIASDVNQLITDLDFLVAETRASIATVQTLWEHHKADYDRAWRLWRVMRDSDLKEDLHQRLKRLNEVYEPIQNLI